MKPVRYHRLAWRELHSEARYYNRKQSGVGLDFLKRVDQAEQRLRSTPLLYPLFDITPARECKVERFPHALYFVELPSEFYIYAVASLQKRPGYWVRRLKKP